MSHQSVLDRLNALEKERAVAERAALEAVAAQYKPMRKNLQVECGNWGHVFSTDYFDEDGELRHCVICGQFTTEVVELCLNNLRQYGSRAAPNFLKPEGVVVFHTAGNVGFKKTLDADGIPKSLAKRQAAVAA